MNINQVACSPSIATTPRAKGLALSVGLCALALAGAASADDKPHFISFDPTGAVATVPVVITSEGVIAGRYIDAQLVRHGFVRARNGAFTTFEAPGAGTGPGQGTYVQAMNEEGVVAGFYYDAAGTYHGFVGAPNAITTVDFPGGSFTDPCNINEKGESAGEYNDDSNDVSHAFVRAPDGTFTVFDAPGAGTSSGTFVGTGLNPGDNLTSRGALAAISQDNNFVYHGVLRTAHGAMTVFDGPNAGTSAGTGVGTFTIGINESETIVGVTVDDAFVVHAFLRSLEGHFTSFGVAGAGTGAGQGTSPSSINDHGDVTGNYIDASNVNHGFLRTHDGHITRFDVPGAGSGAGQGTIPSFNNAQNAVTGVYTDANGVRHGFLRTPPEENRED